MSSASSDPDIWASCKGEQHVQALSGTLYRLVESQEQVATLHYVDTLEEQALLEDLLEQVKPAHPTPVDGLHYLLKTPFRYPPLAWGSRFGRTHEPSIFYAGSTIAVTLAESAYYRFVFWYSMQGEPVKPHLRSEHTLFSAGYRCARGVRLQETPFKSAQTLLRHPQSYHATQLLGSAMRTAEVEAFEYASARDPDAGICIGLFTPRALRSKKPMAMHQWLCEITADMVQFRRFGDKDTHAFPLSMFLVDGKLPLPA